MDHGFRFSDSVGLDTQIQRRGLLGLVYLVCIFDVRCWPITTFRGNVGPLSLSGRSGHEPTCQIGHIGREDPKRKSSVPRSSQLMFEVQRACRARPLSFFSPRVVMALMPANMGKRSALPWFGAANASGQDFGGQRTGD